ncbi:Oidioi.mRNA.OKI2018_I69.XSR.g14046.t1.cds [Oikopleura dioica]|uniref:Oidioi.mRNA.OKI2018_I69.XSR.g14046.t1.cds n=1 Tax=Oikopleura dioica TaxID=34765 RepID=A0ABN7S968_OIKDI|nr:Oidioi.mRNA.OKI2018_I69.XSR.g14046.t1.cds [Oikopleura dioica]
MDFTQDLQLRNEELPEDYWKLNRKENAERISSRILSSSNEQLKECWDWIADEGHNNFLVALIYWSMDEEHLQSGNLRSTFNMGWTALFLREEKAEKWIDAIMFEVDDFGIEPEEENWRELVNIYTEKRAEAGFTMRSGLRIAYAVCVGFLLLTLPGQKAGLEIKAIKDLFADASKKERLGRILKDKSSKAIKGFKSRANWTISQFHRHLNLSATEDTPPGRPSRASSASSGKQGYASSVNSGEAPVNQATTSNPASSQTNQQPPPQSSPVINLVPSVMVPTRPTGTQPQSTQPQSIVLNSNLQRHTDVSEFARQVPTQATLNSHSFDPSMAIRGVTLSESRQRAENQQQNVTQNHMQQVSLAQLNISQQCLNIPSNVSTYPAMSQHVRHPAQYQYRQQTPYGQQFSQNQFSQNQHRQSSFQNPNPSANQQRIPDLPPRNGLGGPFIQYSNELQQYNHYSPGLNRNHVRPQNPTSFLPNISDAPNTQAPQSAGRVPPQISPQLGSLSGTRNRAPPQKSPSGQVQTPVVSQQRQIRPNAPTQQHRPPNQQGILRHPPSRQQTPATSPPVQPQRNGIPQQGHGRVRQIPGLAVRQNEPSLQSQQPQRNASLQRPQQPSQRLNGRPQNQRAQQIIPNNNNGLARAPEFFHCRIFQIACVCDHARLTFQASQPSPDSVPYEIERSTSNENILGEGTWTLHWRKKVKKIASSKEALPTSTNEDPPADDAIVNNAEVEDDPYNMFMQNTPAPALLPGDEDVPPTPQAQPSSPAPPLVPVSPGPKPPQPQPALTASDPTQSSHPSTEVTQPNVTADATSRVLEEEKTTPVAPIDHRDQPSTSKLMPWEKLSTPTIIKPKVEPRSLPMCEPTKNSSEASKKSAPTKESSSVDDASPKKPVKKPTYSKARKKESSKVSIEGKNTETSTSTVKKIVKPYEQVLRDRQYEEHLLKIPDILAGKHKIQFFDDSDVEYSSGDDSSDSGSDVPDYEKYFGPFGPSSPKKVEKTPSPTEASMHDVPQIESPDVASTNDVSMETADEQMDVSPPSLESVPPPSPPEQPSAVDPPHSSPSQLAVPEPSPGAAIRGQDEYLAEYWREYEKRQEEIDLKKAVDKLEKEFRLGKGPTRDRKRTSSHSPPKKKKREPLKSSRAALGKTSNEIKNAPSVSSAKSPRISKENKPPSLVEVRRETPETQNVSSPMHRSSDESAGANIIPIVKSEPSNDELTTKRISASSESSSMADPSDDVIVCESTLKNKYEEFKCPYNPDCNLVFQPKSQPLKNWVLKNKDALDWHIQIYHDSSGKYIPTSCDKCHLRFLTLTVKKQHSRENCDYFRVNFVELLLKISLPESSIEPGKRASRRRKESVKYTEPETNDSDSEEPKKRKVRSRSGRRSGDHSREPHHVYAPNKSRWRSAPDDSSQSKKLKLGIPQRAPMVPLPDESPSTSAVSDAFEERFSSIGQKATSKDTPTDQSPSEEHQPSCSKDDTRIKKEFITPRKEKHQDLDSSDVTDFREFIQESEDSQQSTDIRRESPIEEQVTSEIKVPNSQALDSGTKARDSSEKRERSKKTQFSVEPKQNENQMRAEDAKSSSKTSDQSSTEVDDQPLIGWKKLWEQLQNEDENAAQSADVGGDSMDTGPRKTAIETRNDNSTESLSTNVETTVQVREEESAAESENQLEGNLEAANEATLDDSHPEEAEVENGVMKEPCAECPSDDEPSSDVIVVPERELSEEEIRIRRNKILSEMYNLLRRATSPELFGEIRQVIDALKEHRFKTDSDFKSPERIVEDYKKRVNKQRIIMIIDSDDEPSSPSTIASTSTVVDRTTEISPGTAIKEEASFLESTNSSSGPISTPNNNDDLPARSSSPAPSSSQSKDKDNTQQVSAQNEGTSAASENWPGRRETPVVLPVPIRSSEKPASVVIPAVSFPKQEPMDPESIEARSRRGTFIDEEDERGVICSRVICSNEERLDNDPTTDSSPEDAHSRKRVRPESPISAEMPSTSKQSRRQLDNEQLEIECHSQSSQDSVSSQNTNSPRRLSLHKKPPMDEKKRADNAVNEETDSTLYDAVNKESVNELQTFAIQTLENTDDMTEEQREKYEQRWDEAEELQENTAQKKESLELEILHLQGKHGDQSNKVRELERCEDTRHTFGTRSLRRERNKTSTRIEIRKKEEKMCNNKLAPHHLIPNENLTNGLLKKSEKETCGRVRVQLPPLTATPAKTTSWFNQRTDVARKVVEEEKMVKRTLGSRPGFSVQATEENGVDIVDSLDLDDLPMPTFEKVSELLQDKREKTVSVEESKTPSSAVPTDPRRRPSADTPEVKNVEDSKIEEKKANPLQVTEKLSSPRDPRRRPSMEISEEKRVTDSKSAEKEPGKGVEKTNKPSSSVPKDPRVRPPTGKPAETQFEKRVEQTTKPSLQVPRDPRRRPSTDKPEERKVESRSAAKQVENTLPQQGVSKVRTVTRKVAPSPAKKMRGTSPDPQKKDTLEQAPRYSNGQSQTKHVPKGRVFGGNTPEKPVKMSGQWINRNIASDQLAKQDSLKSRPSPPKPNEKPSKQHAPEPAVPDSPFFMADLPEPIIYDRGNSGSKKQGGSSHRTSNVYQSSKPRDPNCPRYTPPKRPPHYSPPKRPEMPMSLSSEELQGITHVLAEEPFNKTISMVKLDTMSGEDYILLMNEVVHYLDSKQPSLVQCRTEPPEARVVRHLEFLKGIQYKPHEPAGFKKGILMGEKKYMLHIFKFIILDLANIKERAYLARYLMRLPVPKELIQSDQEIHEAWNAYIEKLNEFKEIHKSVVQQRRDGPDTDGVRRDIKQMEEERNQIANRVEKADRKVKSLPNADVWITAARKLREERNKEEEVQMQIREQQTQMKVLESRLERASTRLESLSQQRKGMTTRDLIERTDEELKTAKYRKDELLPKKLADQKRQLQALKEAAADSNPDRIDLLEKVRILRDEVRRYDEAKMEDAKDPSLVAFRKNAKDLARRKEALSNTLRNKQDEEEEINKEVTQKKELFEKEYGGAKMSDEDFQEYGAKMRQEGKKYNDARKMLKYLQQENGLLSRTAELTKKNLQTEEEKLEELERQHGVTGFTELQAKLEAVSTLKQDKDHQKEKTMEEIAQLSEELNAKINAKRESIEPVLKEVRPLRTKHSELNKKMKEAKKKYDSVLADIESSRGNIERELTKIRRHHTDQRAQFQIQRAQLENFRSLQDRIQDAETWRDVLQKKLRESEIQAKQLRDQQRSIREQKSAKKEEEAAVWRKMIKLIQLKEQDGTTKIRKTRPVTVRKEQDRLVL